MKFLLDANIPRSAAVLLRNLGHEVEEAREVLPLGAEDEVVAGRARSERLVLELPDDATPAQINRTLEAFVRDPGFLERLPGRLAIVSLWRVRFRPA